MDNYLYELEFRVRDYECDLQGVVNNANYQHYMEHTRHEFLREAGVDFAKLHAEGLDPMVARLEIEFKQPLRSGDDFICRMNIEKEGRLRMVFHQDIFKKNDNTLVVRGKVTAVCVLNGRLIESDGLYRIFEAYIAKKREAV